MSNHFEHVDVSSFTADDFTPDLLIELHQLVGVDAVTEFGELLKEKRPDLYFEYLVRLQKYYWSQKENENAIDF